MNYDRCGITQIQKQKKKSFIIRSNLAATLTFTRLNVFFLFYNTFSKLLKKKLVCNFWTKICIFN